MDTTDTGIEIKDGKLEAYLSPEEIAGILREYPDLVVSIGKEK